MATPYFSRISSASISARGMTGMPRRRASSDLWVVRAARAEDTTTTSASPTFAAWWGPS